MPKNILLFSDTVSDKVDSASIELVQFAKEISGEDTAHVKLIIPGDDIHAQAESFSKENDVEVLHLQGETSQYRNPEIIIQEILDIANTCETDCFCFFHTTRGCHLAAALSVSLGISCITGVEKVSFVEGNAVYERSLFNGKTVMKIMPETPKAIFTVLPGAFLPSEEEKRNTANGHFEIFKIKHSAKGFETGEIVPEVDQDNSLEDADIIISVGRGIGEEDNMAIVRPLSDLFQNSAIGCSKPICDLNWLPYSRQVGATGKTISPRLYFACGISGSQQHLSGMKGSKWVVAVNTDENAVIFSVSDFGIVEDLRTFIPLLVEKYRKRKGGS